VLNLISVGAHRWITPSARQEVDFPVAAGLASRLGGEHHVIGRAANGVTRSERNGATTVHLLAPRGPTWVFVDRAASLVRRLVRELGPQVVLCTSDAAGALVLIRLGRSPNVPVVVQVQGGLLEPGAEYGSRAKRFAIRSTMRSAVRRADGVRALNDHIAEQVRGTGATTRVAVIGSRVDVHRFAPRTTAPAGTPYIGAVGGLVPVKNHEVLLLACAELTSIGVDARLVLVGDGPLRADLETRAVRLRIDDRVEFLGAVEYGEIPALLRSLTVFAQPSYSEGEPRALLEAQAVGVPAVVSDIPAHRGIVRHDVNGLLVPARDAPEWARAIRTLIDDPSLSARIGAAARTYACEAHDFGTQLDRFAAFIRETATCASVA
jgi:glycosyltransferase involved in cell wall biosynthesis